MQFWNYELVPGTAKTGQENEEPGLYDSSCLYVVEIARLA
jgi:hypothetical protein